MARRHYLVSYDISDDKRRTRIFRLLEGQGDHLQFSVFLCELTRTELTRLRGELLELVHQRDDQVMILDLGPTHVSLETAMEILGRPHEPLVRTLIV